MAGVFLVLVLILVLDFSAGLLAIQAQSLENKGKVVEMIFAEALLVLAHALPYLLGGRAIFFSLIDSTRASINRLLALLSWITVIVGFLLLREGVISNTKPYTFFWFIHLDILDLGGRICFLHGVITVAYYVAVPPLDPEYA